MQQCELNNYVFDSTNERILVGSIDCWQPRISSEGAHAVTTALEKGRVIYLPQLSFFLEPTEQTLLAMSLNPRQGKNISYDPKNLRMRGLEHEEKAAAVVKAMMQRYHHFSTQLLTALVPQYKVEQFSGRTSFRPVEIKGRKPASNHKDDTRLHVDAFPSTPVNKSRILRVFSNINPDGESRLWRLGQPFAEVIRHFLPKVRNMLPFEAEILYRLKLTRQKRSKYDHYMLQIHNAMKDDADYQQQCPAISMNFPPGSTWIVYTDLVSHAALSGRLLLEQTYYPPVKNMLNPALSPQQQMKFVIGSPCAIF